MIERKARPLLWLGTSREDLRGFPADARREAGYELDRVQRGLNPGDWRPMRSIGAGVSEIRIHADGEHRVVYLAKDEEGVIVLHAFEKKSQKTARGDIDLARVRLGMFQRAKDRARTRR